MFEMNQFAARLCWELFNNFYSHPFINLIVVNINRNYCKCCKIQIDIFLKQKPEGKSNTLYEKKSALYFFT